MNKKYAPKREKYLINKNDIKEEMKLIDGSSTDYITPSAKVYKDYGNNMFYPKTPHINKHNGYIYVSITFSNGKNKNRRLHILLAKAFIPNPNNLKIVGHKDNIKNHCEVSNLYWTTNQENTQKANDDGLNIQPKAEQNENSIYIKVLDKCTKNIVGVYGSIRQCARCIKNIDIGFISKVYKNVDYIPRNKKYIYLLSNEEEFNNNKILQNILLEDMPKLNKSPKVFYLINDKNKYKEKFDNQTEASKFCNINQATISQMIKNKNKIIDGWRCEKIKEIKYSESSSFNNLLDKISNKITIENIYTKEKIKFNSSKELSDYLGFKGHCILDYYNTKHTLMDKWKIIAIE
jgi:hypothetical protein